MALPDHNGEIQDCVTRHTIRRAIQRAIQIYRGYFQYPLHHQEMLHSNLQAH